MQSADAGEGCGRESSFSVEIAVVLLEYWPHTDFPPPTRLVYFPRLDRKIVKLPSNCVLSAHSVCIYLFKYIYIYICSIYRHIFFSVLPLSPPVSVFINVAGKFLILAILQIARAHFHSFK